MKKKLGRNEKCWCGSDLKYKKCHLKREESTAVPISQALSDFKTEFSKKDCLAPNAPHECSEKIIKAHTVSKSSLDSIAEQRHVYSRQLSHLSQATPFQAPFKKVGINKASIFNGFCSEHDNILFSPIEDKNFQCTKEQCLLFGYRVLSRELYGKLAMNRQAEHLKKLDAGKDQFGQFMIQLLSSDMESGSALGIKDYTYTKIIYDQAIQTEDYNDIRYYCIELSFPPVIMVAGGKSPQFDFDKKRLQDLLTVERAQGFQLNIFASGGKDFILFTWVKQDLKVIGQFIQSLKKYSLNEQANIAAWYAIVMMENVFCKISWFDLLEASTQDQINKALIEELENYEYDSYLDIEPLDILTDWKAEKIHTNLTPN